MVVLRTWQPQTWVITGDNFSYQEVMESPGPIMAGLATLALALGFGALRFLRGLMLYLLPKPGEGPSKEMQARPRCCSVSAHLCMPQPALVRLMLHSLPRNWAA